MDTAWLLVCYPIDLSLLLVVSIGLQRAVRVMLRWPAQVLPGGRLLASADETGNVAVADLRMLGSPRQPLLWQVHSLSVFCSHCTGTPAHKRCGCAVMGMSLPLAFCVLNASQCGCSRRQCVVPEQAKGLVHAKSSGGCVMRLGRGRGAECVHTGAAQCLAAGMLSWHWSHESR